MSYHPFSDANFRKTFWLFWITTFVLLSFLFNYYLHIDFFTALTDSFVSIPVFILFLGITNYGYFKYRYNNLHAPIVLFFLFFISLLYVALTYGLLYLLNHGNPEYLHFLKDSLPFRVILAWLLFFGMTMVNYVQHQSAQVNRTNEREEELEKMAKEAELNKIYQQLQPHFMFNSLNSIQVLIHSAPDKAEEMTQNLSDFLRRSLRKIDEEYVCFDEEMKALSLYLQLEKIRFEDRLNIKFTIDENTKETSLPPLILQPIIENAIKFGLYGTLHEVTIEIKAFEKDGFLHIHVFNPFDEDAQPPKGTGFGLQSIKRRLYLIVGRNDLLQYYSEHNIFITQLKIPQNR